MKLRISKDFPRATILKLIGATYPHVLADSTVTFALGRARNPHLSGTCSGLTHWDLDRADGFGGLTPIRVTVKIPGRTLYRRPEFAERCRQLRRKGGYLRQQWTSFGEDLAHTILHELGHVQQALDGRTHGPFEAEADARAYELRRRHSRLFRECAREFEKCAPEEYKGPFVFRSGV